MKRRPLEIGRPNEQAVTGSGLIRVRDELGLSLDPKDFADPGCLSCNGRGVVVRLRHGDQIARKDAPGDSSPGEQKSIEGDGWVRTLGSCGCAERARSRARARLAKPWWKGGR